MNGDAGFVANAPLAGFWLVHTNQGLLVLPRDEPGLNWRAPGASSEQGLPWLTGSGAEVSFTDCAVPGVDRLTGPVEMERALRRGNVLMAAVNLSVGCAAYEAAIAYAQWIKVAQLKQAHCGLECILAVDGRVRLQILQRGGMLTGGS